VPAPDFVGTSEAVDEVGKDSKYGDWVFQGDQMLGQLLDALDRKGLAGNTLVIVTSDNGAAGRPYPPLRGQKTQIYEGGHRVPFVVRWPGMIKPGAVSDQTICLTDLMATCAEIVGAELPADAGEDSVSLLPALLGTAQGPLREATVHQSASRQLAIRQGPWKLVFAGKGKGKDKQETALYDLATDIGESRNVAGAHPEIVARLTALMKRFIADGRSTPGAAQPAEAGVKWPVP
jgi:arylsulfatase A-like enzyme